MPTASKLSEYDLYAREISHFQHTGYSGITLVYVIKGNVEFVSEDSRLHLAENDVLCVNKNTAYEIRGEAHNIVIMLEVSNHFFAKYYKSYFYYQYTLSPQQNTSYKSIYIDNIRVLLAKMFISYLKGNDELALLEINHSLSEVLLILATYFKEKASIPKKNATYSKRIEHAIAFLEENYNQSISLQKIAKKEHVSFSYLSRLFKKEVGTNYIQYLKQLRFEHATYDLINSAKPIYQIAQEHGFSSTRQFITLFKEHNGKTPSQYRKDYKESPQKQIAPKKHTLHTETPSITAVTQPADAVEVISTLSNTINNTTSVTPIQEEYSAVEDLRIHLHNHPKTRQPSALKYIITIGELNELLKEHVQQQVLMVKQEAQIDYIDASHLISGNTILPEFQTDEPAVTYSPYNNTDIVISFLKQHDISLFVRIYHDSVSKDPGSYIEKTTKFLHYCINLYGKSYMSNWRFVYYSEDCTDSTRQTFETIYLQVREAIKSCLPEAQIGVFYAFEKDNDNAVPPIFQTRWIKNTDFIGYEASPGQEIGFDTLNANREARNGASHIKEKTAFVTECLRAHNVHVPLVLMRWNTLTGQTRHTNGSFFRAALIFNTLLDLPAEVSSVALSLNTEILQETLPQRIDVSGIALFYIFNLKRPVFYVLKFLRQMQGKVIAHGTDYIVTKTQFGYQLILTNTAVFNPSLSLQENLIGNFKKKKKILLQGISPGHYQIKQYIFDQQHGALYRLYQLFQTKYGRSTEMIDYIDRKTIPHLNVYDEFLPQDEWIMLADMDINALHFYELRAVSAQV